MPNVFHPAADTIFRTGFFGGLGLAGATAAFLWYLVRTPYATEAGVIREQPIPFSHKHHVGDAGIDCRYCHTSVEQSAFAGIPSTGICMHCHAYLFNDQAMLAPVRESSRTGRPLHWVRIHDVPDFAYFHHGVHVQKGVACVTCHGRVDRMPLVWREHSLLMQWCLDCHRDPVPHLRPREFVFRMASLEELATTDEFREYLRRELPEVDAPQPGLPSVRRALAQRYRVKSYTNCSNCHW